MKVFKVFLFVWITLFSLNTYSQEIPIQFVITDSFGIEIPNKSIFVRASFLSDTNISNIEYQETHSLKTNVFGIASFWIGKGQSTNVGIYSNLDATWINPQLEYFIKIEVDSAGAGYLDLAILPYRFPVVSIKSNYSDSSIFSHTADSANVSIHSNISKYSEFADTAVTSLFSDTSYFTLNIDPGAFRDSSVTNEIQTLADVLFVDSNANGRSINNLESLIIGDTMYSSSTALAINRKDAGLLLPRLTKTERDLLQNPSQGLLVYCLDCENEGRVSVYDGSTWELLSQTNSAGSPPILATNGVSQIGFSTATFAGSIVDSGSTAVYTSGFCWGISPYPTIANNISSANIMDTNGQMKGSVFGLDSNTTYYVRAFATNGAGTSYGPMVTFKTDGLRYVGEEYQGGFIGYIFEPGDYGYIQGEQHGIILFPFDYPNPRPWGPSACSNGNDFYDFPFTNTFQHINDSLRVNSHIGYGYYNHNLILNQSTICPIQPHVVAVIDTVLWNGYSDWILPTQEDLNAFLLNSLIFSNNPGLGFVSPTESRLYMSSCTGGPYDPSSSSSAYNSTDKVSMSQYSITNSGYPDFTVTVTISQFKIWYGVTNKYIRLIRYF